MSHKFKIGDRVKIKTLKDVHSEEDYPEEYLNQKGIIIKISIYSSQYPYKIMFDNKNIREDDDTWNWAEENLELCEIDEIIKEYYIIIHKTTKGFVTWDGNMSADIADADRSLNKGMAEKELEYFDNPEDYEIKRMIVKYDID